MRLVYTQTAGISPRRNPRRGNLYFLTVKKYREKYG